MGVKTFAVVAILLVFLVINIQSATLTFNFVVERKLVNLDGFVKDALTINKNFIGPTIEAVVGDNLLISVTNRAIIQEVITLHWHGISQQGTPWADGTAFIANCPITFGSSYLYNYTADEPGTFWYHAHVGSLNAEGTTGMIVVYSPPPALADTTTLVQTTSQFGTTKYDAELRVILTDWYHPSAYTLNTMLEHNPFEWVGNGDSILINGKGESKHCSFNGTTTTLTSTSSDGTTTSVTTTCKGKREIFELDRDKTYLVRVLNAAYLAFFNVAIAGHYFTVLGVDGNSYTDPVDVNSLDLSSGQRVMALLRFNRTLPSVDLLHNETFRMQVQTDWRGHDNTKAGVAHAYVTYDNASKITGDNVSPLVPPNESRNWHEWYDLVHSATTPSTTTSAETCPSSAEVTKTFQVDSMQQFVSANTGRGLSPATVTPGVADTKLSWTVFNNSRLMMPATPLLLTAYLNSLNNSAGSAARRLSGASSIAQHSPVTHRDALSALDNSVEKVQQLSSMHHKSHFWDQYEIISSQHGPGSNVALPRESMRTFEMTEMPLMNPALQPLRVELGDVVEVVVQAYASASGGCDLHPWHLHGHSFWLVSRGAGLYDPSSAAANAFAHPLRQDTVSGYPSNHSESRGQSSPKGVWQDPCGWFVIRFRANNSGMWLFHCHIGWHMEMGMALVFDEASELVPAPPGDYGMCGAAGEIGAISAFAVEKVKIVTNTSTNTVTVGDTNDDFVHASIFQVMLSFVVVLAVVAAVALFCVWLSRRKMNGMFVTLDAAAQESVSGATTNPLSRHTVAEGEGDVEMSYMDSVDRFEEVSFVAAARTAMHKHRSSKRHGEEYSSFEDSGEHGNLTAVQSDLPGSKVGNAFRSVRKSLTWRSSQGLKK